MKHQMSNGILTLYLEGKIDSANANGLEKELRALCDDEPVTGLVLDMEELLYTASSGLRVILRLCQDYPDTKIINASSEVYEILEMTGFTEMVPVSRAYRRLNLEGCEVIGRGSNGLVYRLDADTVVKTYFSPDCLPDIQLERELARKAFVLGIPTAISYDVVRVGESYGSVFEMVNSRSLARIVQREPDRLDESARISVELLKKIHAIELKAGEMPDKRLATLERIEFLKTYLPAAQYEKLYGLIAAIPPDRHLLHGDCHIRNIMMQDGEPLLIDMETLCQGNPVFEFASLYMAYRGFGETDPTGVTDYMGISFEQCGEIMRKIFCEYFGFRGEASYRALLDRVRVIAYANMMRRTIRRQGDMEYGRSFISYCADRLADLLPRTDSLTL